MEEDSSVVATYLFRGIEYVVTMNCEGGSTLTVEVEDRLTADQWRGTFDAPYLEDLTRKTGNYKQFPIFVSMLESALTQNSDSVGLDLLTYTDLESLKQRKAGVGTSTVPPARSPAVQSKRYLILTYSVEFDRIHYPLPLPYMGKPEPRTLQETIRQLRLELRKYKQQGSTKDFRMKELEKLKKDYARLQDDKEELEAEFVEYQRQVENSGKGGATQQLRLLKGMVATLEEELVAQRSKHARQASARRKEYNALLQEVEDLRASERNLRVRVKSLTNELAVYKRRRDHGVINNARSRSRDRVAMDTSTGSRKNTSSRITPRSRLSTSDASQRNLSNRSSLRHSGALSSRESSFNRDHSRLSRQSKDHSFGRNRSLSSDRSCSRDRGGNRSWSSDHSRGSVRERSRDRSTERNSRLGLGVRSRSPSPAGTHYPRFNPTAYIKEKERQKQEAGMKKRREVRQQLRSSDDRFSKSSPATSNRNTGHLRRHSRSSSVGSLRSRTSSVESLSDIGMTSDSSGPKRTGRPLNSRRMNAWTNSNMKNGLPHGPSKNGKILSSTPDRDGHTRRRIPDKENKAPVNGIEDSDYFDRSAEISEIDARLNRLQQFMKANVK